MYSSIVGIAGAVSDRVWGFFGWLRNEIWNRLSSFWTQVWGGLVWVKDQLWGGFSWVKDQIWGLVSYAISQVYQAILGIPAAVSQLGSALWAQIAPRFQWVIDKAWGFFTWLKDEIWNRFVWFKDWVWNSLIYWKDFLWGKLIDLKDWVWNSLVYWKDFLWGKLLEFKDWAWNSLMGLYNTYIKPGIDSIQKNVPTLQDLLTGFDAAFMAAWTWLTNALKPLIDYFTTEFWIPMQQKSTELLNSARTIGQDWWSKVMHEYTHGSPITPEEATGKMGLIVGSALVAEIGVDILGMVAELLGVGQLETPYWAMNALLKTLGMDGVVSKFIMKRVERSIMVPYEYALNEELRPELLSPILMDRAFFHGQIDVGTWFKLYGYRGIPQDMANKWYLSMHRNASPRELRNLADGITLDWGWAAQQLHEEGYLGVTADNMVEAMQRIPTKDEIKGIRSEMIKDYALSLLPENVLIEELTSLQRKPEEIALDIRIAKLEEKRSLMKEMIGLQEAAYLKDQMSDELYYQALLGYGMSSERATIKLARSRIKKLKTSKTEQQDEQRGIYAATVITRIREGLISSSNGAVELSTLGWGPGLIDDVLRAANLAYDTDYKLELVKIYREARAKEIIDSEELKRLLTPLITVEERRDAIIAEEEIRALPKPKASKTSAAS
jgi:hypothetical protein